MITPPEPTADLEPTRHAFTPQEMFDDLGGYEELAIATRFKTSINDLASSSPTQFIRALIFADLRRKGASDGGAYKQAQEMKLGLVKDYFREEEETEEPDPEGELGKDE